MSAQPRTPLTRQQYEELCRYGDNRPHKFDKPPNRNLIRRNLLAHYRMEIGTGYYQITEFGRAVLESERETDPTKKQTLVITFEENPDALAMPRMKMEAGYIVIEGLPLTAKISRIEPGRYGFKGIGTGCP